MTEVRAAGPLLWFRAALLSIIAVVTAVVSHAAAGGLLPSALWLCLLGGVTILPAAWWLRRRVSSPGLVAAVVAGQAAIHLLLSLAAGHRGDPPAPPLPPPTTGSWTGQLMGGHTEPPLTPSWGWTAHLVEHLWEVGPAMALAHLLGAAVLGIWLAVGESAAWSLLLVLGRFVLLLLGCASTAIAPLPRRGPRRARPGAGPMLPAWLQSGLVTPRGPPAPSGCL